MFDTPLRYARPTRVFDGMGGSVETLAGATKVLMCDPELNDSSMEISFDAMTDVRIGDLIEVPTNAIARGEQL